MIVDGHYRRATLRPLSLPAPNRPGGPHRRLTVGVIWFEVMIRGIPVHVANAGQGVNAIESAYDVIAALHELEENWNARKSRYPSHAGLPHPINLNVGRIAGGDWASSVPAWCAIDVRLQVLVKVGHGPSFCRNAVRENGSLVSPRRSLP